ncbi:Phosphoribosyl-AMP cyclohydrolase (EC 3.5.4.19) [uncultured Gammaproteobacteria bacterium]|jgi:phosphoribosyl-AMP cyclohydrolase|nr:Phosphoribosyl-AMP cyclohydrolase (EC 3.5.4.19) [uncultured Gammaproteobacteria bacterium]CAC9626792.1 Phosphoribosyl-AMP cyclohydrolase (EC 3.5.4.19) [uncultured Gammaproteobacteria bacterium]CAC9964744.1 Phosphoribosyl-AMP cyclohydrolase (EC 3.5.4.19) [uncultured Gammaproteobacteria bacterium]
MIVNALEKIRFDETGLIPAIAQDFETGEILMFAWMNKEALLLTIEKQQAIYYSRSRKKLWFKGEESGHTQLIKEIYTDCDNDVILLKVAQIGGIACHTGRKSCFFQKLDNNKWQTITKVLKDPKDIYG